VPATPAGKGEATPATAIRTLLEEASATKSARHAKIPTPLAATEIQPFLYWKK
jgi:hypothetical protein